MVKIDKWQVYLQFNGRLVHIGYADNENSAAQWLKWTLEKVLSSSLSEKQRSYFTKLYNQFEDDVLSHPPPKFTEMQTSEEVI